MFPYLSSITQQTCGYLYTNKGDVQKDNLLIKKAYFSLLRQQAPSFDEQK
jgi:hypothetical protein